jgi:hypothetical protein
MGIPRLIVAFVALFACNAQANVRLAVIGDGPAQKAGLTDLMTAEFKGGDGIELVEREKLESVVNEQSIQAMLGGHGDRERIGGLVAADFLALVTANDREIRLAVCDVHVGLKLADFTLPANTPDAATTLAKQTAGTVNRFRAGVTHVAVVPDFVCRDLAFDRNYLQSDLAEVLRTQYRLVPGMALVAIDEARSIAQEREVSNAAGKAVFAPVFVEAAYRTARGDAGFTVAITLTARDNAGKPLVERELPAVAIDEAGPALLQVFTQDLLPLTRPVGEPTAVDVEGQFKQLVAQADAFAQWGQWPRSAALREAALLLKPDADEQRIRLVREYSRHNDRPFEQWPKAARMQAGDSFREGVVQQCIADWRRSLSHCEFLVRNRRISREEATGLAWDAVRSICGVRVADAEKLGDCERLKKDFVREVFVRIVSLPPATRGMLPGTGGAGNAPGFRMEAALFRCDGNHRTKEDLDLIVDLLNNRLPEKVAPSYELNFFLKACGQERQNDQSRSYRFTPEEYAGFVDSLVKSPRQGVQVYGRYARLCQQLAADRTPTAERLAEAQAIVALARSAGYDTQESGYFMGQLNDEVTRLQSALNRRNAPPQQAAAQPAPRPKKPEIEPAKITLVPIELMLQRRLKNQEQLTSDVRWRGAGGWGGVTDYAAFDTGLDALWSQGCLLLVRNGKTAVETLAEEGLAIGDVTADGKYVWAACQYGRGLEIFDYQGQHLATIGKDAGLPEANQYGFFVHAVSPGRVLATGTFGNEYRAWVAIVSFDGSRSTVDVILEAAKARDWQAADNYSNPDPTLGFRPEGILVRMPEKPGATHYAYVLRDRFTPLVVDVAARKVWAYPWDERDRDAWSWVSGEHTPEHQQQRALMLRTVDVASGIVPPQKPTDAWRIGRPLRPDSLAQVGDWVYLAEEFAWLRTNRTTGETQVIVPDRRALPDHGSGGRWSLANSSQFGLVAFRNGKLFRVTLNDAAE